MQMHIIHMHACAYVGMHVKYLSKQYKTIKTSWAKPSDLFIFYFFFCMAEYLM